MIYELKHSTNLVIRLDNPEIQSVDALLIRLVGDRVAGTMLKTLIYWMPKSVRADGNVYKSWRHWMAECVLSISQIKRIHHKGILEQFGIERKLKKADGAPTNHYKVNFKDLLNKLADFLKVEVEQVKMWMVDDAPYSRLFKKAKPKIESSSAPGLDEQVVSISEKQPTLPFDISEEQKVVDDSPKLGSYTAKEYWHIVKSQLQAIVQKETFESFIKRAEYKDYESSVKTFVIQAYNMYQCEMLEGRLYPRMMRTLHDIVGDEYNIKFVT